MEQRAEQLQGKLDKLEEKRVGATQQMQRLLNLRCPSSSSTTRDGYQTSRLAERSATRWTFAGLERGLRIL